MQIAVCKVPVNVLGTHRCRQNGEIAIFTRFFFFFQLYEASNLAASIGNGLAVMCNGAQSAIQNLSITLRWAYMLNFIGCELGQIVVNFFKSRESISRFFHFLIFCFYLFNGETKCNAISSIHPSIQWFVQFAHRMHRCTNKLENAWLCIA